MTASAPCQCLALRPDPGQCACSPTARSRYAARLSGPLRDRISLRAVMTPPQPGHADEPGRPPPSSASRVSAMPGIGSRTQLRPGCNQAE